MQKNTKIFQPLEASSTGSAICFPTIGKMRPKFSNLWKIFDRKETQRTQKFQTLENQITFNG